VDFYATAADTLQSWEQQGILAQDTEEALYVYEIAFAVDGQPNQIKGLISRVKIEEFSKGVVLPHEETLSKAKTDRLNLMNATNCNFSQIYSLYLDDGAQTRTRLEELTSGTPEIEFSDDDGLIHRLWRICNQAHIAEIASHFAARKLFIADGHHRYETALNYRNAQREQGNARPGDACDFVMMMMVDMENPGLHAFATHRMVRALPDFDSAEILQKCAVYFDIVEQPDPETMQDVLDGLFAQNKKAFGFFAGGSSWQLLTLKADHEQDILLPGKSAASNGLDVTVLHTLVLERLFGINAQNMANGSNLTYTRELAEALNAVRNGKANCAFILNPTRVSEIRDVSLAGEKMPQKSTYFYPKLITGLVMNKLV